MPFSFKTTLIVVGVFTFIVCVLASFALVQLATERSPPSRCDFSGVSPMEGFVTLISAEGRPIYHSRVKRHKFDWADRRLCLETYTGQLLEWRGEFLWSDQPMRLTMDALIADQTEPVDPIPYSQSFQ